MLELKQQKEREIKELDKAGISTEEADRKRKEFAREWEQARQKQRVQDIMDQSDDSDEPPVLDVHATFKRFVSEKRFSAPDRHLTFKDYYKLNFPNDVPEIVCDIFCYLANQYHYRTGYLTRDTYERLLNAQLENRLLETEDQKQRKKRFAWRCTFEGLDSQI